jgi:uncharacterized membrane protein
MRRALLTVGFGTSESSEKIFSDMVVLYLSISLFVFLWWSERE